MPEKDIVRRGYGGHLEFAPFAFCIAAVSRPMDIVVNEELKAYIDPLTPDEHDALERSLLAEGCRDALVLWGDILVDGHNRHAICQKHGLPFQTVQNTRFQSMEDVQLWMIDQHLGRRSLSDFQRGVLALRKREIVSTRRAQREQAAAAEQPAAEGAAAASSAEAPASPKEDALDTREAVARAARLRSGQVQMIEAIHQNAAPEVVAALKSGMLSLNAAAAVATLPAAEQTAAADKGELKQAAKRVREAKRKPAPEIDEAGDEAPEAEASPPAGNADVADLQRQVAKLKAENKKLTAENAVLRKQVLTLLDRSRPGAAEDAQPVAATTGAAVDEDPPF